MSIKIRHNHQATTNKDNALSHIDIFLWLETHKTLSSNNSQKRKENDALSYNVLVSALASTCEAHQRTHLQAHVEHALPRTHKRMRGACTKRVLPRTSTLACTHARGQNALSRVHVWSTHSLVPVGVSAKRLLTRSRWHAQGAYSRTRPQ